MSSEPKTVKVFNLTDVSTPNLEQRKFVNQHIAIGGRMCEPGQYIEQTDSPQLREDCKHLVSIGALSIDTLPPPYRMARAAKDNADGLVSPAHIQHLDIKETKVVDVQPAPPAAIEAEATPAIEPPPVEEPRPSKRR